MSAKFSDALTEFRSTCDPVAEAHVAMMEASMAKLFPDPCGPMCADSNGVPCGFHDARIEELDVDARVIASELTKQPAMLFEWSLMDVGEVGQPVSRILAAIFRGESPSTNDVEAARKGMTDLLMDEGRRLLGKGWAA